MSRGESLTVAILQQRETSTLLSTVPLLYDIRTRNCIQFQAPISQSPSATLSPSTNFDFPGPPFCICRIFSRRCFGVPLDLPGLRCPCISRTLSKLLCFGGEFVCGYFAATDLLTSTNACLCSGFSISYLAIGFERRFRSAYTQR